MIKKFNSLKTTLCFFSIVFFVSSCDENIEVPQSEASAQTEDANTNVNANGVCDYDLNETTLTSTGWTKIFEENFASDLTKWNIWTGGAYNNELQYYQAANLQVANGNLVVTAKKETITGATTPSDPTSKTFQYTSGR